MFLKEPYLKPAQDISMSERPKAKDEANAKDGRAPNVVHRILRHLRCGCREASLQLLNDQQLPRLVHQVARAQEGEQEH